MEPVTTALATTVVAILTPYARKTAEAFISIAGEAAYQKANGLFETLKTRWAGKAASANLDEFCQDPEGSRDILEVVLRKQLTIDQALRNDIERRVQETAPLIAVFQKMHQADGVVGVDAEEISRGAISVHQEADTATTITGVRVKKVS